MLGSFEDSEDLVQETFLRAWRGRTTFADWGGPALRAWLYRIATNACLDALRRRSRRVMPTDLVPAGDPAVPPPPPADLPWLQPYPDRLLEPVASAADEPGAVIVSRETMEIAFLAAIQHLSPRQRAALLLRDVLGWSAKETASLLDTSVAAVNSALQRARATLRDRLPERRAEWGRSSAPTREELELLGRYIEAHERADVDALAALLREDARLTMPPHPIWYDGRAAIVTASAKGFDPGFGQLRSEVGAANTQPTAAHYLCAPGERGFRPLALDLLRIEDGLIAEIQTFAMSFSPLFVVRGMDISRTTEAS